MNTLMLFIYHYKLYCKIFIEKKRFNVPYETNEKTTDAIV
jgi:hypothetical protein